MRFTKVTQMNSDFTPGKNVYVNFDLVRYLEPTSWDSEGKTVSYTRVYFGTLSEGDSDYIEVMESPDDILIGKRFMGGDR